MKFKLKFECSKSPRQAVRIPVRMISKCGLAPLLASVTLLCAPSQAPVPHIPSTDVDRTMKLFNSALGVECTFCHVEGDWKDGSKAPFKTAAAMWQMVQTLNSEQLANTGGVTCVTCHAGRLMPSRIPPEKWQAVADHWPASAAENMKLTMSVYSASLGVGCDHCHDPADWKSTVKPQFAVTRRMVAMFDVFPRFMPPGARTQCYMCHKGNKQPIR
jgi:Photosynthetic reaction centre cytochrome C subunit